MALAHEFDLLLSDQFSQVALCRLLGDFQLRFRSDSPERNAKSDLLQRPSLALVEITARLQPVDDGRLHRNGVDGRSIELVSAILQSRRRSRVVCRFAPEGVELHSAQGKIRPAGFEPATLGSEDRAPNDATSKPDAELRQPQIAEVPPVVPSGQHHQHPPSEALELAAVWDSLPEAGRAGILAMVRAASLTLSE